MHHLLRAIEYLETTITFSLKYQTKVYYITLFRL